VLHSDLEPIREWITDGQNGLLVPPEDLDTIIPALRRALTDDNFVERASELNAVIVENKLSDSFIRPKIIELYQQVAESNKAHLAVT
jgi:glycosyltransferase involved in cell wall biosynthesis